MRLHGILKAIVFLIVMVTISNTNYAQEAGVQIKNQDGLNIISGNYPGDQNTTFTAYCPELKKNKISDVVTFSGSVITDQSGKSPGEFRGRVILRDNHTQKTLVSKDITNEKEPFQVLIPAGVAGVTLLLATASGKSEIIANLPVFEMPVATAISNAENFVFPNIVLQNGITNCTGPFDGISGNTQLLARKNELFKLAESPDKLYFTFPSDYTGPTEVKVKEGGLESASTIRVVGMDFYAPTTVIKRGDQVNIRLTTIGLKDLTEPVVIHIINQSENVVSMTGGNEQYLAITPGKVGAADSYVSEIVLNGLSQGGFSIVADIPQIPSTWWLNSGFTGMEITPLLFDELRKFLEEQDKAAEKVKQAVAALAKRIAEAARQAKIQALEDSIKKLDEKIKESNEKIKKLKKEIKDKEKERIRVEYILELLNAAKNAREKAKEVYEGASNKTKNEKKKFETIAKGFEEKAKKKMNPEEKATYSASDLDQSQMDFDRKVSENNNELNDKNEELKKEEKNKEELIKQREQVKKELANEQAKAKKQQAGTSQKKTGK
jgi:hypothetical protein